MNEHRYILEPYKGMKTRHSCPLCKDTSFTYYIDTETGEHLSPDVGRCNHESKCGYHYTPKQYFQDNNIDTPQPIAFSRPKIAIPEQKPVSFIPVEIFKASLGSIEANHFIKFLTDLFGVEVTNELICKYFIGTSRYQFKNKEFPGYISEKGSTVYWQIDTKGKIRTGKIMLYSPLTGKRVKEPFNHVTWVHSVLKTPEFELKQCLFGSHLLQDNTKPVAIVESEKTAIIASVYLPQFIWIAAGSLNNLNADKCSILKGRTVTLFPDLKGFDKWSSKAKELSYITTFNVSDLLERKASETERQQAFDLADYLIKFDYKDFVIPPIHEPITGDMAHENTKGTYTQLQPTITSQASIATSEVKELHSEPCAQQPYLPKPLHPATGRLRELEDSFILLAQRGKVKQTNRQELVKMFDRYKRTRPTANELDELVSLMCLN